MPIVQSADGTKIAYSTLGSGPALIVVDGALGHRALGFGDELATLLSHRFTVFTYDRRGRGESGDSLPYTVDREIEDLAALLEKAGGGAFVYGMSSGAALALEAANRGLPIARLAAFEAPFIVDDSRPPVTEEYIAGLAADLARGDRAAAVRRFMRLVGMPRPVIALMSFFRMLKKLESAAHTLPYDAEIVGPHQLGRPLPEGRYRGITIPTIVIDGGKSPPFLRNAQVAIANAIAGAERATLPGQDHRVAASAIGPVLVGFFRDEAGNRLRQAG